MAIIKGQNLRIMIGSKFVAKSKSCTLHIAVKTEDGSTKDDVDVNGIAWDNPEVTGASWDVTVDALTTDDDATAITTKDIIGMIGQKLSLTFDETSGDRNRSPKNSSLKLSGSAYLNDGKIDAQNRQNSTTGYQFIGSGAIA